MPSKETPSGSCEKTGGGEWTALREALELMVKELDWYAGKHGLGPARLQYALVRGRAALAAAAPAPPHQLSNYDYNKLVSDAMHWRKLQMDAPPPQDGQGAELHPTGAITVNAVTGPNGPFNLLPITDAERKAYEKETAALGPPRGGSSSDLAATTNLSAADLLGLIWRQYGVHGDIPAATLERIEQFLARPLISAEFFLHQREIDGPTMLTVRQIAGLLNEYAGGSK